MVPSERSCWDLSEYTSFYIKRYFFICKNKFLGEKLEKGFSAVFSDILSKVSDFVNSDYYIGKITSKSIRLQPVFNLKKDLKLKITDFSCEKIRNSSNYIYNYAHSFFGEDF